MGYFISVSEKATEHTVNHAIEVAKSAGLPFIPRDRRTLNTMRAEGFEGFFIVDNNYLITFYGDSPFRFHPGMARLRILALTRGERDRLLETAGVKPGWRILDCTAGLCSDAAVFAYAVGKQGQVVALEASLPVFLVSQSGLSYYPFSGLEEARAYQQVSLYHQRYEDYLATTPKGKFDLIYFDPMFERPITSSSGIEPLRQVARYGLLEPAYLRKALTIATTGVVVKGTIRCSLWDELPPDRLANSKGSQIVYGIYYR